jgi:hypothetical protein
MNGRRAKMLRKEAIELTGKVAPDVNREKLVKKIWRDTRNVKDFRAVIAEIIKASDEQKA